MADGVATVGPVLLGSVSVSSDVALQLLSVGREPPLVLALAVLALESLLKAAVPDQTSE